MFFFAISLIVPHKLIMMQSLMQSITFNISGPLNITNLWTMSLFLAIFTLWDSQVHICSSYSGNKASYVEAFVDNRFGFGTTLSVLNVNLDSSYVWFMKNFGNSWFGCKDNVVEDMIIFKNFLNVFRWNTYVWQFIKEGNTHNLEVGFWLRESERRDLISIHK